MIVIKRTIEWYAHEKPTLILLDHCASNYIGYETVVWFDH